MSGPRVLIVDDNALNVALARCLLEAAGALVDEVPTAVGLEARVASWQPDVLLLDLRLPELDGLTAMLRLRAAETDRRLPIAAFTAHAMKGAAAMLRSAGFDSYLPKPIEARTFAAQVLALVGAQPR